MNIRQRHDTEEIRSAYRGMLITERALFPYLPADKQNEIHRQDIKRIRRMIREYSRQYPDPLALSLRDGGRRQQWSGDDMCDGPIIYWIDPDTSMTDDDCREIMEDERLDVHSPYDCSGQAFTMSITYSRTPAGIAFIHTIHYDY